MKVKLGVGIAIASIAVFGLSACSAAKTSSQPAAGAAASTAPAYNAPAATTAATGTAVSLGTATTSLGTIVVDGKGMTVYEFAKDTKGGSSSTCTGQCASNWLAVPAGTSAPTLKGVTGTAGAIKGVDGKQQLTLNGWPLYYYVGDTAAGQTSGQGVGKIWWVLSPAGDPISK